MKKVLGLVLVLVLALGMFMVGSAEETYKVGMTFNLANLTWAELCTRAKEYGAQLGMEITVVDSKDDAATQIGQIENFTQSGMPSNTCV